MESIEISAALESIALFFAQAVKKGDNGEELSALHDRVAPFAYLLAVTMPFERGSAAILETLLMAIYKVHGYSYTNLMEGQQRADLEAMTALTYQQFLENFPDIIDIESPD